MSIHAIPETNELDSTKEGSAGIDVEALYRRYAPMVLRRCRRMLKDEELALDALQDTFVQLVRNAGRLDGASPAGLVYRVATNVCLVKLRTRRRHPETRDDALLQLLAGADDPAANGIARAVVERVFEQESDSTRTMAVLHLVDGLTLDEVALEVGLSRSGVRKRLRGLLARAEALANEAGQRRAA